MPHRSRIQLAAEPLPVRQDLRPVVATSLLAAALLGVTSVAGLLYGARGLYTPDPATLPTFLGQDGITLVVVLPLLLWSVRAARRGSRACLTRCQSSDRPNAPI